MKVSRTPATIPGIVSGRVTCRNPADPVAYRSRAAATSDGSSRSIDTYSGRIANGRKPYTMPSTTEKSVLSSTIGCAIVQH